MSAPALSETLFDPQSPVCPACGNRGFTSYTGGKPHPKGVIRCTGCGIYVDRSSGLRVILGEEEETPGAPAEVIDTEEPVAPELYLINWEQAPHPWLIVWPPINEEHLGAIVATADTEEEAEDIRKIWKEAWREGWLACRKFDAIRNT